LRFATGFVAFMPILAVMEWIAVVIALVVAGFVAWRLRSPGAVTDARIASQLAVLNERIASVHDRVASVEGGQAGIGTSLATTGAVATGLNEAAEAIRRDLAEARGELARLQASAVERRALETRSADSLRRLEQVIAGTSAKGAAGESLVELALSRLPPEWQLRDFRVGNRVVEFALRLPNGLALPIDSKWPATNLLECFAASEEPAERQRLKSQIESAVLEKAGEVTRYIDPESTAGFAIAVVPDAVDELCGALKGDCLRQNVVLLGQAMLLPYLLLVFQTVLRTSTTIDIEKLAGHIHGAEQHLLDLREEVEGRLSRAITMLGNSRDELRLRTSRVSSSLAAIQSRSDA
jgi:DNA recombination protein RmuC